MPSFDLNLSFEQFRYLANQGQYDMIPLSLTFMNDHLSPVSLFSRFQSLPYSFLMESASTQHEHARYSIIGVQPAWTLIYHSNSLHITNPQNECSSIPTQTPFKFVSDHLKTLSQAPYTDPLFPQLLGCFGFAGYSMVHCFEPSVHCTHTPQLPQMIWIVPSIILIIDHHQHQLHVITPCYLCSEKNLENTYSSALDTLDDFNKKFLTQPFTPLPLSQPSSVGVKKYLSDFSSEWNKDEFISAIKKAQSYIEKGDIFQVVLSQKFIKKTQASPFSIYRFLRYLNPSPYMFYLHTPEFTLTGSSPETMIRCQNQNLYLKPIAGTRPRGQTPDQDKSLAQELISDPKEIAEHIMLVDLGRNDLGRVCQGGSIAVHQKQFKVVEKYSHVMHIVSQLVGKLDVDRFSLFDALISSFPAGTLSGAPKVRAMQIIDELEPSSREAYGGIFGYITFDQHMDTCIIIRSVTLHRQTATVQSGAGIVYDSSPENEYNETIHKASAVFQAILMAEQDSSL